MRLRIVLVVVLGTCGVSTVLTGCGGGRASGGGLDVVASTNVYGDIARQIGGPRVHVTSILSNPDADPHLFEPGTSNGLAVATADVVIQNGAGYDAFMTKLVNASPSSKRRVVTMADVLGINGHDANPHFWYDVPRLPTIAHAIADAFTQADPAHASAYARGEQRFVARLAPLDREVERIRSTHGGAPVAYTEPVPGYLVTAAGLSNLAPEGFTRSIEDGAEPSPQAVSEMNDLVAHRRVRLLLYNSQATSPITSRIRAAAEAARVPVVGVTETLPARLAFQQWQLGQARAIARALGA